MTEFKTHNLAEFKDMVGEVAKILAGKKNENSAVVVALHGDLGAGKTTFTQELAKLWGAKEQVTSPTFVIQKKYVLNNAPFSELVHMDVYRLEESNEISVLGWETLLTEINIVVLVEWAEKITDKLPENTLHIYIDWINEEERAIHIK